MEKESKNPELSLPQYWSSRYLDGRAGWDNRTPHPFLEEIVRAYPQFITGKRVLVIGAGPGHDAEYFSHQGANVTSIDFSEEALRRFHQYYPQSQVDYRLLDFFHLPEDLSPETVFEHTLLCAIDPGRYGNYFRSLRNLLKPGGHYLAIIWNKTPAGDQGPPFSVSNEIVREGLQEGFKILEETPVTKTISGREGTETFWVVERT